MRNERPESDMLSSPARALLAVFLFLLLTLLAVRFWASDRQHEFAGPTHITAGASGVFVFASGDIIHLSVEGALLSVYGPERTRLDDDPIDLSLLDSNLLLLAEQQPGRVRLCELKTWACRSVAPGATAAIDRQFKVLSTDRDDSWLLTDAAGDRLWRLDESAGVLTPVLASTTLAGPNGLAYDADGNLWIADTDNRRIVELLSQGDGSFLAGREYSAMNEWTIGSRFYPMMIERGADGHLWVTQAAEFSEPHSDLVAYDIDSGPIDSVGLPEGAYATDIAMLGDEVLVTDMERFTIYRVDIATRAVEEFGDVDLRERLSAYHSQSIRFGRLSTAALVGMIAVAALLIFVAIRHTPRERRFSQPSDSIDIESATGGIPETRGVHWLEHDPHSRWMTNGFEKLFYALFGLLCLASIVIYSLVNGQPSSADNGVVSGADRVGLILLLTCLVTASFIPLIRLTAGMFRRHLGTDGKRLHVELEDGRRISARPDQLCWNDRVVLLGDLTIPIRTGWGKGLYKDGEIQNWLGPLLRDASRLSEWQILRHQWKHRDRMILTASVVAAVLATVLVVLKLLEL